MILETSYQVRVTEIRVPLRGSSLTRVIGLVSCSDGSFFLFLRRLGCVGCVVPSLSVAAAVFSFKSLRFCFLIVIRVVGSKALLQLHYRGSGLSLSLSFPRTQDRISVLAFESAFCGGSLGGCPV